MLSQGFFRCARCRSNLRAGWRGHRTRAVRQYATSTAAASTPIPQSPASILGTVTTEFDKLSPRFELQPSQIKIIKSPSDFYETLKAKILKAQDRIYLSTLYVGKAEHELISTLQEALRRNPKLRISILTDALRGTRETPEPSCASLLAPLIEEFGERRVEIRMFHTPNLTGIRKAVVPRRINEGWGLQHMKLYGIDDEVILSGANLSNDYFTDRQDRYHVFSCPNLTEYFARIHHAVCKLSFSILPATKERDAAAGYTMLWPSDNPSPSPLENPKAFKQQATTTLGSLVHLTTLTPKPESKSSTVVYPLFQFTPIMHPDTSTELPAIRKLLSQLSTPTWSGTKWTFTAGYFNTTPEIRRLLLRSAMNWCSGTILTASPWANGFYKSAGVSGMLPDGYTYLSKRFLQAVSKRGLDSFITLKEWRRGTINEEGGWSYHAKGIWVTLPGEQDIGPSISVVGSSNYTKRAYGLDLEANVAIVTRDEGLMKRLREEEEWLQEFAQPMTKEEYEKPERKVRWQVRAAMWIVTILGGAL